MSNTAVEVFHRVADAFVQGKVIEVLDDTYAEDVVVEHPFNIPEPTKVLGRDELRQRMRNMLNRPISVEMTNVVVHETTDPEVVIGEYETHLTSKETGKKVTAANILVVRVRDGKIISSRDYHNHALLAETMTS